jgi:hypothetical protein
MSATVTTDGNGGTTVAYPPNQYPGYGYGMGMGGYGNGAGCGNGTNATLQAENFLAHLVTNGDRHQGEHHILNRLAQIQSDIPTMEGAVQSAISASQNSVQGQAATYALSGQNQVSNIALAAANQTAQVQLQAAALNAETANLVNQSRYETNAQVRLVGDQASANALFNAQSFGAASTQAAVNTGLLAAGIIADGDRTRALINSNYIETLNRQLATAQNEIIELRGDRNSMGRHHETEIKVSQQVNQNQQQQQQQATLGAVLARLEGLTQIAHATNQNIIAGNTGAVQTGAQNANPTNVRT